MHDLYSSKTYLISYVLRFSLMRDLITEINGLSIGLDFPASDLVFMSHAHTDHIVRGVKCPVIMSKLTAALIHHRTGGNYNLMLNYPNLELLDSGHVIGSKALLINSDKKIFYTGDFTTHDRFFLKGLKPVKCDTLIIEATYGLPGYDLPDPNEVIREARDVILDDLARGYNPCLVGYALGKAQLITKIAEGLGKVYASEDIRMINNLCNNYGYKILVPDSLNKQDSNFIYITHNINDAYRIPNSKVYSFTGWVRQGIEGFPLSDHAGFTDLLKFVKACKPEEVFTHHGFAREFADFLRTEGFNAVSLD